MRVDPQGAVPYPDAAPALTFDRSLELGSEQLQRGEARAAVETLEAALQQHPGHQRGRNLLGLALFKLGELGKSEALYRELIEDHPEDATLRVNLGLVFLKSTSYADAARCFETAIDLQPGHRKAHNYLGLALAQLGDHARAKECFDRAGNPAMAEKMGQAASRPIATVEASGAVVETRAVRTEESPSEAAPAQAAAATAPAAAEAPPEPKPFPTAVQTTPSGGMRAAAAVIGSIRPRPVIAIAPQSSEALDRAAAAQEAAQAAAAAQAAEPSRRSTLTDAQPVPPPVATPWVEEPAEADAHAAPVHEQVQDEDADDHGAHADDHGAPADDRGAPADDHAAQHEPTEAEQQAYEDGQAEYAERTHDAAVEPVEHPPHDAYEAHDSHVAPAADEHAQAAEDHAPAAEEHAQAAPAVAPPAPPAEVARPLADVHAARPPPPPTDSLGSAPSALADYTHRQRLAVPTTEGGFAIGPTEVLIHVHGEMLLRLDGLVASWGSMAVRPELKRFRGKATDKPFGEGGRRMLRATGHGRFVISREGRHFTALELGDEPAYFREEVLFAFEETLLFENGRVPSRTGADLHLVHLRGRGRLLLASHGTPRSAEVIKGEPLRIPMDQLVGWHGPNIQPRLVPICDEAPELGVALELAGEGRALVDAPDEPR